MPIIILAAGLVSLWLLLCTRLGLVLVPVALVVGGVMLAAWCLGVLAAAIGLPALRLKCWLEERWAKRLRRKAAAQEEAYRIWREWRAKTGGTPPYRTKEMAEALRLYHEWGGKGIPGEPPHRPAGGH